MSLKILFVDDEPEILSGYKRIFFKLKNEWQQFYALSGNEAINIIQNNEIDVVISDMRMPGMDGDELLNKIQKEFPSILRIILSGHQNEYKIIRSLSSAHQFLIKPCQPEQIKQTIEKAYYLRNMIEDEAILKYINGINELPSLPQIFIELEKELSREEVSFNRIELIINKDPILTAKILQVVNSGFFGIPRKISNLQEALSLLGTNLVKSIIIYLETFSVKKFDSEISNYISHIGNHSFKTAEICKIITKIEIVPRAESEDIFIAAILHDIGKLLLLNNKMYFNEITELSKNKQLSLSEAESELYGFNHSAIGAYLLGIWGLPKEVIESVAFHHTPSKIISNTVNNTLLLHVANAFAKYSHNEYKFEYLDIEHEFVDKSISENKVKLWWNEIKRLKENQ